MFQEKSREILAGLLHGDESTWFAYGRYFLVISAALIRLNETRMTNKTISYLINTVMAEAEGSTQLTGPPRLATGHSPKRAASECRSHKLR